VINFNEAVSIRMKNKYNTWSSGVKESYTERDQRTAQLRFENDFFPVNSSPKFTIAKDDRVYTIGSCFARNVEQSLLSKGIEVPTTEININEDLYVSKPRFSNTVLNKYNPHSMAAEILRGLGELSYEDDGLIEVTENKFYDPQASHLPVLDRKDAIEIRGHLDSTSKKILTSNVFMFTLGLTETWFDKETGIAFNQINPAHLKPIRERLLFKNVTVEEAYSELEKAFIMLEKHVPNAKVVITVSPVPLLNTFTNMDIITANTYSKATLRVVAQMLSDTFNFVDYYPSYEMVINSNRDYSWGEDKAHVTDDVVNNVIGTFVERYIQNNEAVK
jgi:hypothetical protein